MNFQTNVGQCSYDSWLDYRMVSTMEDGVGCNHLRLFHHIEWFNPDNGSFSGNSRGLNTIYFSSEDYNKVLI